MSYSSDRQAGRSFDCSFHFPWLKGRHGARHRRAISQFHFLFSDLYDRVGPEYGHAEARKSPTVDGKVQRNADGKEVRFPVILTLGEKEIARRIVLQFKQFIWYVHKPYLPS